MIDNRHLLDAATRKSLSAFIQRFFAEASGGEKYVHNWHIDLMANYLEGCLSGDIRRLIINVPPRAMKSICASVSFIAWALGNEPHKKFIAVSYSQDLARKHSLDCKRIMESQVYREIFPHTRLSTERNTNTEYTTTRGGHRIATSVDGTLTGLGGDIIVIDDPMKPQDAHSETTRKSVNEWYNNTLYSRLNNKEEGCIIIIMQRLHEDDLVGHVLEQEDWVHLNLPALAEEPEAYEIAPKLIKPYIITREVDEPLHPARESLASLKRTAQNIGSYAFASQYQQRPAPIGGGIVKWDWFRLYADLPSEGPDRIIQSWDTAMKAGSNHDFSVCTTWHVYGENCYLVNVFRKRLEFPDLLRAVISLSDQYKPKTILIEDKGAGTQLIQNLRHQKLRTEAIIPDTDKITRLAGQTPRIENGQVFIPQSADWLADFKNEFILFPSGRHDDQVDSVSQALAWIYQPKKGGMF